VRLKIRLLAEDTPAMHCPWDEARNAASLEVRLRVRVRVRVT